MLRKRSVRAAIHDGHCEVYGNDLKCQFTGEFRLAVAHLADDRQLLVSSSIRCKNFLRNV
jgi:hypothetical protein